MTRCFILLFLSLLTGCVTTQYLPPVEDRVRPVKILSGVHVVQSGESLYSISWRYGRDFRELAAINHIKPPYIIYSGQKLSLKAGPFVARPVPTQPIKKLEISRSKVFSTTPPPPVVPIQTSHWIWPAEGQVVGQFTNISNGNNGIDIASSEGAPIIATASGRVVYSGSGLRGLGRLIIIKHNDQFLSAYAHNRKLTVNQGDYVKVGQKIAEMGRSDTNRVKLHFEIRKNGVPVDPLMYLARK